MTAHREPVGKLVSALGRQTGATAAERRAGAASFINARVYSTRTLESIPHNPVQGTRSKVSDQEVEGTQVSVNG